MGFANIVKDASIDMLLLYVMIINVMFLNVKKDTPNFADIIEIIRGVTVGCMYKHENRFEMFEKIEKKLKEVNN